MLTSDQIPHTALPDGSLQTNTDWRCISTVVMRRATGASNATLPCGVTDSEHATAGDDREGIKDMPAGATVAGNPACILKK